MEKCPTTIKLVELEELTDAFELVRQLRSQINFDTFRERYLLQIRFGYQLYSISEGDRILGVVGFRLVSTLARGTSITVDDLVVDGNQRKKGIGYQLIEFVVGYARKIGVESVFLSARPEAIPFYEKLGFGLHSSPEMKIEVKNSPV